MPARRTARDYARAAARHREREAKELAAPFRLTPREIDCLALYGLGLTYKEVGVQLHIGEETVKHHLSGARWVLGASTSREAYAEALRRGLLLPPS